MRYLAGILVLFSIATSIAQQNDPDLVYDFFISDTSAVLQQVFADPNTYKLKIAFSRVYDDSAGCLQFRTWTYRDTVSEYFFPGSLVKLPVALSVAQTVNRNKHLDKNFADTLIDSSSYYKKRSIHDDLMLLLSVSDNPAYNRLYNFVGCQNINEYLKQKEYRKSIVIRRLEAGDETYQQSSLPVKVINKDHKTVYSHPLLKPKKIRDHTKADSLVGVGYYLKDSLISKPKSFRYSNYIDICDIHDMLVSLVYPEFAAHSAFLTTTAQRDSLLAFMKQGPDRAHDTAFNDTAVFHPNFLNFNLFGSQKENPYPGAEYFNKSAMAYGFLADCGYLRDTITHVEFFLTVYIYVNKDGILNDTTYEYNTIGIPFMKRLGELCYKGILDQRFPSQTK